VSRRLWHLGTALDGVSTKKQHCGDEPSAEPAQARPGDAYADAGASGQRSSAAGPRRQTYHVVMTSGAERCAPERCHKRGPCLISPGTVHGLPQYAFLSQNLPRLEALAPSCAARPSLPECPYCHS